MSEKAAADPGPAWARPSLAHEAFMEAGPGLADRQGREEVGNVEGSEPLSRGQPVPQPRSPGFSTVPTCPLPTLLLQGGAERVPTPAEGPPSPRLTWAAWTQCNAR